MLVRPQIRVGTSLRAWRGRQLSALDISRTPSAADDGQARQSVVQATCTHQGNSKAGTHIQESFQSTTRNGSLSKPCGEQRASDAIMPIPLRILPPPPHHHHTRTRNSQGASPCWCWLYEACTNLAGRAASSQGDPRRGPSRLPSRCGRSSLSVTDVLQFGKVGVQVEPCLDLYLLASMCKDELRTRCMLYIYAAQLLSSHTNAQPGTCSWQHKNEINQFLTAICLHLACIVYRKAYRAQKVADESKTRTYPLCATAVSSVLSLFLLSPSFLTPGEVDKVTLPSSRIYIIYQESQRSGVSTRECGTARNSQDTKYDAIP